MSPDKGRIDRLRQMIAPVFEGKLIVDVADLRVTLRALDHFTDRVIVLAERLVVAEARIAVLEAELDQHRPADEAAS